MGRNRWLIPLMLIGGPIALLFGLVALLACSGSADFGMTARGGQVRIYLTDAPSDRLAEANVTISGAWLVPMEADDAAGAERVPLALTSHGPRTLNLLDLRNGVELLLAGAIVPEGRYGELRLVVEAAEVALAPGLAFEDGSIRRDLRVPSGMSSGIKVDLDAPLVAEDGSTTLVVVDFDVDDNFVFQGNPDTPAEMRDVQFTPRLKERRRVSIDLP